MDGWMVVVVEEVGGLSLAGGNCGFFSCVFCRTGLILGDKFVPWCTIPFQGNLLRNTRRVRSSNWGSEIGYKGDSAFWRMWWAVKNMFDLSVVRYMVNWFIIFLKDNMPGHGKKTVRMNFFLLLMVYYGFIMSSRTYEIRSSTSTPWIGVKPPSHVLMVFVHTSDSPYNSWFTTSSSSWFRHPLLLPLCGDQAFLFFWFTYNNAAVRRRAPVTIITVLLFDIS
jgi:hypothetical protein